ncbi:MAG: hypothetical protein HY459_02465 [Parcubacteria group bacterium]|nr:hypothetical protein [Parcubacteria group bacterium]
MRKTILGSLGIALSLALLLSTEGRALEKLEAEIDAAVSSLNGIHAEANSISNERAMGISLPELDERIRRVHSGLERAYDALFARMDSFELRAIRAGMRHPIAATTFRMIAVGDAGALLRLIEVYQAERTEMARFGPRARVDFLRSWAERTKEFAASRKADIARNRAELLFEVGDGGCVSFDSEECHGVKIIPIEKAALEEALAP